MTYDSDNKTVEELATDYMRAYFAEVTVFGENSLKAQEYKTCWDLFRNLDKYIRDQKDLSTQKKQHQSLVDRCSYFIKLLLQKFKQK